MPTHEGGCLCGNVRYEVNADPVCFTGFGRSVCQHASSARGTAATFFERPPFRVTFGRARRYAMTNGSNGDCDAVFFCATCATKLFFEFERFPDTIGVMSETLDMSATRWARCCRSAIVESRRWRGHY